MSEPSASAARPIVWTIAGSDSGGGAGIQADLATLRDLGCHGCSVITTLTAQNSVAVNLSQAVSDEMLLSQLDTLLTDMPPKAVKIGLIANQQQLDLLALWLQQHLPEVPLVVDPVMVASCGDALAASESQTAAPNTAQGTTHTAAGKSTPVRLNYAPLARIATLLTPNVKELALLGDMSGVTEDFSSWASAAQTLAASLPCHLLAKGGDRTTAKAQDLVIFKNLPHSSALHSHNGFVLESPRQTTSHNHGSGCTLSSAIAAFLAQDWILPDALVLAKAYINGALTHAYGVGQGPGPLGRPGWPDALAWMPAIWPLAHYPQNSPAATPVFKQLPQDLGLYPVVSDVDLLETLLKAGCQTIQLRIKAHATDAYEMAQLEPNIIRAIRLGEQYQARVFINDHWRLALKHGAFGVHLGQEDLACAPEALSAIAQAGMALGLSSHGYFEALLALQQRPSYLALGHIFPTTTKVMPSLPQGLNRLRHYAATFAQELPLVAIGGINGDNLDAVRATGATNVAIVRAITQAPNPAMAFQQLQQQWYGREPRHLRQCLSSREFIRYASQILLPRVGEQGQLALGHKTVAIVGLGGLGHQVAHALAAAGIGRLRLIDPDKVELGNLPRQLLYTEQDIGDYKVQVAAKRLGAAFADCALEAVVHRFDEQSAPLLDGAHLVIDASDNFPCRHALNQACVARQLPLISAAFSGDQGLLCHVHPAKLPEAGCYQCLFPRDSRSNGRCSEQGVLGPAVQSLAALQSLLAINALLGETSSLGKLYRFNSVTLELTQARLQADPQCSCCAPVTQGTITEGLAS
ncbi:ThiF family adenylyltransferase [Shewanella sp. YIC-542]|uniref:ThiF family adenylyltransferase n=1 Tax=Shewanella mytili TaxID=3377111 RepID=UPI00398E8428